MQSLVKKKKQLLKDIVENRVLDCKLEYEFLVNFRLSY